MTPTQLQAIKADIAADPVMSALPRNGDSNYEIARLYNLPPTVAMSVWRTEVPTKTIRSAITLSSYTPNDAADNTATFTNRALLAQTKQINLQIMLQGLDHVDMSLPQARADLRDAVTQLPTGAAGALISAGGASGATVLTACLRNATRAEKLLNAGTSTTGTVTANLLGFEGTVTDRDIEASWNA
ncbi:MAG TPA: hypothetical protein PLN42_09900 [Anaerolineae bacterium]|mgnify:CR=1 FL=1|nr:hypothetical protein [Anaerolineae bacterium]